jgi:hypothetical protein
VAIAERHAATADEQHRMLRKQRHGCEFFVSQVCYDLDHTRNLLSDYSYTCKDQGVDPRPTVLTLAPCGSTSTLDFMTWLGIDVPPWLRREIARSEDPLTQSYDECLTNARALIAFCRRLGLPFGINVESLTNRKVEIEASVDLARDIRDLHSPTRVSPVSLSRATVISASMRALRDAARSGGVAARRGRTSACRRCMLL